MTIQLLHPYNGNRPGIYSSMGSTEEARLVGLGLARYWTDGIDGKNTQFSEAEKAAGQALVSGDVIVFNGTPDPDPNSKVSPITAERAATATANDALLSSILAANTTNAITIVFPQPFVFSAQQTARSSVQLVGYGKASQITFVPTTSTATWFIWSRNSADASQVMEELQLIGCGVRNLYVRSDRSIRANCFYMLGVDFPFFDCEVFGFKGYGLRLGNCRVGGGVRYTSYYNGYTDLADGTNNVPDLWIDSPTDAWDPSNLLSIADVQVYYPFGTGILVDGAYSNVIGGSALVVHQLARADTDFEENFLLAFPYYNGAAAALGWTAGSVPRNEYAAHHVGSASQPTVSGRLWQANHALYNVGLRVKANSFGDASVRNRIGQGRFIGGQTLYTVLIDGASDVQFISSEITSASPYAANVTADASTDVFTYSSATAASVVTTVPPTGTPAFMNAGTPPAGMSNSLVYYIIKLTSTTFKLARTYADAIAGTAVNFTDAGISVIVFAGGLPLCVLGSSRVQLDSRSYIDNGACAAWHDDTSSIIGNARTGPLWTLYPVSRQESPEQMLFQARNVPVDAVADVQMQKLYGGRRYRPTRITVQQKSTTTVTGATLGIFSATTGGGTALVAAAALSGLGSANTTKDMTIAASGAVVIGADSVANVIIPPYIYTSIAGAAGAVVDVFVWGYPAD